MFPYEEMANMSIISIIVNAKIKEIPFIFFLKCINENTILISIFGKKEKYLKLFGRIIQEFLTA